MKMVEKVARAIYEADDPWSAAFPWPDMGSDEQSADNYRRIARAAIEAMREPNVQMTAVHVEMAGNELCWNADAATAGRVYSAMIDAALKETA